MKVDGVGRDNKRKAAPKRIVRNLQVFIDFKLPLARLEIDCAVKMQYARAIDIRGIQSAAGAVLRHANSHLRPHSTRVAIGKVPGRASGNRRRAKQSSKKLASLPDLHPLNFSRQKACTRVFWLPILVSYPRHSPVNIGSLRFPKQSQKVGAFTALCENSFNRNRAEMSQAVHRRIENAGFDSGPICVK